jgi:cell division protein FtsQ
MDPPEAPEHSPIDPRFEARRLEVARAAGRRRLRWVLVAALVVVLMAGSYLAVRAPFLSVDRVDVSGAVYTDPVAIQAAVNAAMGQPMLTLDTAAITRLLESQAWVRQARVERDWPRGVRIEVDERVPLAVYGATDGRWRVVDDEGRVLAITTGRPVDYVLLAGQGPPLPPGELVPDAIAGAVRVAQALPPSLKARTYEIAFDGAGNLELHLQPRGTVLLGSPDALRDKLVAALTVLERTNPATLGVLDVRAPAKPVTTPTTTPLTGGAP